jgi:triosephosphate isomerase
MRRRMIAANWKMNLDLPRARELVAGIQRGMQEIPDSVEVVVCPPYVHLFPMAKALAGTRIALGAQNLYHEASGAFTGEVSPAMIAETGCRYVILGHSERRHTIGHHEDDRMINLKVRAAIAAGIAPILCVGETLLERDADQTLDVLTFQLRAGLLGAAIPNPHALVIAYEPVWAIGTGRNATPQQAQEAHAHLRRELRAWGGSVADEVSILYGGSVKPENAGEIFSQPDVDGGLIGGASLKVESFVGIARAGLAAKPA